MSFASYTHARPELDRTLPVRFAVVVGKGAIPRWQARCVERLLRVEGAEASALIVLPHAEAASLDADAGVLWRRLAGSPGMRPREAFAPRSLGGALADVPHLEWDGTVDASGAPALDDAQLERLGALDLDFVLDLTPEGLSGDVGRTCAEGVWTFRHGQVDGRDGGPLGFREMLRGSPVICSALVRAGDARGPERVLHRGCFRTQFDSLGQSRAAPLLGVAGWAARECRRLVALRSTGGRETALAPPSTNGHGTANPPAPAHAAAPSPSNMEVLRFAVGVGYHYAANIWRELFRHEQWNVGLVEAPVQSLVEARKVDVRWLPDPQRGSFLADPFGRTLDGTVHILAEEFDYNTRLGRIASLSVGEDGSIARRPNVIEIPGHASYPYLFETGGELYCIPETSSAREVRLFRARALPDDWEDLGAIVEDFAAADSTLFRLDGRWWLLCVDAEDEPNTHLHAWWANELTGPWHRHLLNPIKSDPRSSRPAGPPIVHDGALYRPAQDCSRKYGGAVAINRIVHLDPERFEEVVVKMIRPDPDGPFPDGFHTVSPVGDRMLVDGRRRIFVPEQFRRVAGARLRSLVRSG